MHFEQLPKNFNARTTSHENFLIVNNVSHFCKGKKDFTVFKKQ